MVLTGKERFRVTNRSRNVTLAESSERAGNPVSRGVGLMGRKSLAPGQALIIQPCSGVVSFFMRFPIDVLFLGEDGRIVHVVQDLVPWRSSKIVRGSKRVVELPAGTIAESGTEVGDVVDITAI